MYSVYSTIYEPITRIYDKPHSDSASVLPVHSYIFFNIVPTIVDIIIAIVYLSMAFNVYFGLICFVTMALYLVATIFVTEWRTKYR